MVGMTAMPEAAIARELAVAYIGIAVVANKAAGLENNPLSMEVIMATLAEAMDRVKGLISEFVSADNYSDSGKA
jgi:5'-methylthioinosine phosphorylase